MKCVILAAGEGKRMRPLTVHRPKVMLPVAGKPILEHLLDRAIEAGFDEFLFITHFQAGAVRKHFGNGRAWKTKIEYVDQGAAGGTGHAVAALRGRFRRPFTLLYGDALFGVKDLRKLREDDGPTLAAKPVEDASPYGLLTIRKGRLTGIEEKPPTPRAGWVNAGAYVLTPRIVDRCADLKASPRGEFELTDALADAARNGGVHVVRCDTWQDIGRPWDLVTAQEELMGTTTPHVAGRVDPSAVLEGAVVVEKGAHVRHGTVVEGPCIIQTGARVGPNAYLRGATVVGSGCHVGAGVEVKNSILMANTSVPHLTYVGDSVLGSRVNLGAGTNVANLKHSNRNVRVQLEDGSWVDTGRRKFGVVVGDDVKTGINSTLNVGAVLGAGTRVMPGALVNGWVPEGSIVA